MTWPLSVNTCSTVSYRKELNCFYETKMHGVIGALTAPTQFLPINNNYDFAEMLANGLRAERLSHRCRYSAQERLHRQPGPALHWSYQATD